MKITESLEYNKVLKNNTNNEKFNSLKEKFKNTKTQIKCNCDSCNKIDICRHNKLWLCNECSLISDLDKNIKNTIANLLGIKPELLFNLRKFLKRVIVPKRLVPIILKNYHFFSLFDLDEVKKTLDEPQMILGFVSYTAIIKDDNIKDQIILFYSDSPTGEIQGKYSFSLV